MTNINLSLQNVESFLEKGSVESLSGAALAANKKLHDKSGKGSDFLGWVNLPSSVSESEINKIDETAKQLSGNSEIVIVIGIGGSYLGAKAVLKGLGNSFSFLQKERKHPHILFAGHHLDEDYMHELLEVIEGREVSCIIISKSGTTTEPALGFRLIKNYIEEKYGKEESKQRIVAITDKERGALKKLADAEGYTSFVIPDDVGGRFSVLTPVGLLPIAIAGYDLRLLLKGASDVEQATGPEVSFEDNVCAQYAAARNALYKTGKNIEVLANYNPKLYFFGEWWKQLYGESEGKENKGIFPAAVSFTTDLHSMGQYIQEGERVLIETVISVTTPNKTIEIPTDPDNLDQLNFLAGKRISEVNLMAELGTLLAHVDGGVPNIRIEIPELNEYNLGQLIYFFEKACGISGYMLDVNPFDQPGVEAYKKNMFALLGKPGFEAEGEKLRKRL